MNYWVEFVFEKKCICIYIYMLYQILSIPRTQMTPIFEGQHHQNMNFSNKKHGSFGFQVHIGMSHQKQIGTSLQTVCIAPGVSPSPERQGRFTNPKVFCRSSLSLSLYDPQRWASDVEMKELRKTTTWWALCLSDWLTLAENGSVFLYIGRFYFTPPHEVALDGLRSESSIKLRYSKGSPFR